MLKSSRSRWFLFFAVLSTLCMAWIFLPVFPLNLVTVSPDAPKYYPLSYVADLFAQMLSGEKTFQPDLLRYCILPPLFWQELQYAVPCIAAGAGIAWLLMRRGLCAFAACTGGLFFALSGYSFTLVNAGHLGYFNILLYFPFSFALLDLCFTSKSWLPAAFLGATVAWSEIQQPDIWLFFVALLAAFGLWRCWTTWRSERTWRFATQVLPKFLLSAAVMALLGWNSFRTALGETFEGRKEQIAKSTAKSKSTADNEEKQWIFATNWSMPPKDLLEAVVPGVFGDESARPDYPLAPEQHPYWGRLGRPHESVFKPGRSMPNYRQHTLYLGVPFALLALFGATVAIKRRKEGDGVFWLGVFCIATVLAMGRYTPLYRIVYHLPMMRWLRAPVKFWHLAEFAAAILSAYGMQAVLDAQGKTRRKIAWGATAFAGTLLLVLLGCALSSQNTAKHITSLGLGGAADLLAKYMTLNALRSFLLAIATAAALFAAVHWNNRKRLAAIVCITLLGAVEMSAVCRRYIVPVDVTLDYEPNAIVRALEKKVPGKDCAFIDFSNGLRRDWLSRSLELNGFANAAPDFNDTKDPRIALWKEKQENIAEYWRAQGVRFVILPRKGLTREQLQELSLVPLGEYSKTARGLRTNPQGDSGVILCEYTKAQPLPVKQPAPNSPAFAISIATTLALIAWSILSIVKQRKVRTA